MIVNIARHRCHDGRESQVNSKAKGLEILLDCGSDVGEPRPRLPLSRLPILERNRRAE